MTWLSFLIPLDRVLLFAGTLKATTAKANETSAHAKLH
jgi:hypothetical protein